MRFPKFNKNDDKTYLEITKKKKQTTKTGLFLTPTQQQQASQAQTTTTTTKWQSAKTTVLTPNTPVSTSKTDYNLIYNLTKTTTKTKSATKLFSPNSVLVKTIKSNTATTGGRFTKRLKRNNHIILTGSKAKRVTNTETPVCAYLNEKNKIKCQNYEINTTPLNVHHHMTTRSSSASKLNTPSQATKQPSDLKNLFKTSLSQLSKFVSKSKLMSKSPSGSLHSSSSDQSSILSTSSSTTSSCSSSPIIQPTAKLVTMTPKALINKLTTDNGKRRPIMGITALILQNYKANGSCTTSGAIYPNMYLIGIPIEFKGHVGGDNHTNDMNKRVGDSANNSKRRGTTGMRSQMSQCRLEIYGSSDSDNMTDCIL